MSFLETQTFPHWYHFIQFKIQQKSSENTKINFPNVKSSGNILPICVIRRDPIPQI
jgi:hypothetical protein